MKKLSMMITGASALALAAFVSAPAGAIQIAPGVGPAADTNVSLVQFRDRGGFRGGGARSSRGGGMRSFGGGGARSFRGGGMRSFRGSAGTRSVRGPSRFSARSFRGSRRAAVRRGFESRRFVQSRSVQRRSFRSRDFDRRRFARIDRRWDGRRWRGDWRRHRHVRRHFHRHRFLGAVIVGVPFGYAAVAYNPCYDWLYGPRGWGYYWNYDRCPV